MLGHHQSQVPMDAEPMEDNLIESQNDAVMGNEWTCLHLGVRASGIDMGLTDSISDMSLKEPVDSCCGSFTSLSSLSAEICDEELEQYYNMMPPEIQIGYIDCLILYAETDRKGAEEFRLHLINEIQIASNGPVIARLYDCPELISLARGQFSHLEESVKRSTFILMYLTKNFVKDKWMQFSSEACLMNSIGDPSKQWCVIPVYTEKRNSNFSVPMGLNSLKGINYYNNDMFYRKGVAKLIGDKVHVRVRANEKHKTEQKKWLERFKQDHTM